MPRGRPKGSKSKGTVGRPRKNFDKSSKNPGKAVRKSSEPSPPRERKPVLVKQGKLTAAQVGPLIAKVSAACDSVLSGEKSNGGSKFKSAIRVFTNELRRQMLSIGDEYMGSTASERKFLQLSRDRAALQKSLLTASKHVNDTRWDLRRTNQQQKAMVDGQQDLQELQSVLRDLSGMKASISSCIRVVTIAIIRSISSDKFAGCAISKRHTRTRCSSRFGAAQAAASRQRVLASGGGHVSFSQPRQVENCE